MNQHPTLTPTPAIHTSASAAALRLNWRQHVGLAIVAAGALVQFAAVGHHLAAA